jgi:hypothetical protein
MLGICGVFRVDKNSGNGGGQTVQKSDEMRSYWTINARRSQNSLFLQLRGALAFKLLPDRILVVSVVRDSPFSGCFGLGNF